MFPSGDEPYIFSDSLPAGSTNTATAPILAQQDDSFTTTAPAGSMFMTLVVFNFPNPANTAAASPQFPLVEILTRPQSGDGDPWQLLQSTAASGDRSISLNADQVSAPFVDYTFVPLDPVAAPGVYQIQFKQNGATSFDGLSWNVRFTVNDGLTTATNQVGVTFVLDTASTQSGWLATPGQLTLPPAPLDMAAALSGLTLAGQTPAVAPQHLIAARGYTLNVPIGNYGSGPLRISAITAPASPNGFTMSGTPLVIPPGSQAVLTAGFTSAVAGQTGSPATAAAFTLTCDDTQAAAAGPHYSNVSLFATAGNIEIVLVLDLSGSMSTNDAGGQTRWFQVEAIVGQISQLLPAFAGSTDFCSEVVYPAANGASEGQVVAKQVPIDNTLGGKISTPLNEMTPIDSTPMAGTAAALGGIYTAMGSPANPPTDCGLFQPSTSQGFGRNYRRIVMMSDGLSNVGDDPNTIPASYYTSRNIQATTLAYGIPGSGQVDPDTLKAIATNSTPVGGTVLFFAADQSGLPSVQLPMILAKQLASSLGLSFAIDPDATIRVGQTNKHPVIILEDDTRAGFIVCAPTPAASEILQVQLLTPLGEKVTPSTAASFGMTYAQTSLTKAYYASPATLNDGKGKVRSGVWTIEVTAGDLDIPGVAPSLSVVETLAYAYMATVDSALTFSVGSVSPITHAGDTVELVAALSEHGQPVLGANVTAEIVPSGQGFDNWLAAQVVTQLEMEEARRALGALQDVQALFIKTQALKAKGIVYPGGGGATSQTLTLQARTGTYRGSFAPTQQPGTYAFLVVATGQDSKGNPFVRHQTWTTVATPLADASSTLVSIAYQVVGTQMQATLRVWPQDRFGNVILVDPTVSQAIKVLLAGGAVASGPLTWNLDASYTQIFTFPLTASPTVGIGVNGIAVLPVGGLPVFSKLRFVNEALQYIKGGEAAPGANTHTDPTKALGDPSRKPLTSLLALGAGGMGTFAVSGPPLHATAAVVFIWPDTSLRAYAVDVLPAQAGVGWVEIGRSRGVTQVFPLVHKPRPPIDTRGWEIEVSGKLAGETFDVTIPLQGKLHPPVDPLGRIGTKGIRAIRIRDLSGRVTNPDGTPSSTPGASVLGIGFEV